MDNQYSLEIFSSPAGIEYVNAVRPIDLQIMEIVNTDAYKIAHLHSMGADFSKAPGYLRAYLGALEDVNKTLALSNANKIVLLINQLLEIVNATVDLFTPEQTTDMNTNLNHANVMLEFYA